MHRAWGVKQEEDNNWKTVHSGTDPIVHSKPTTVNSETRSLADVKVVSDGVVISNAEPDTHCVVYQTDGKQVVNTVINEGTRKITLQKGEAYILSIDGRTLKFAL